MRTPARVAAFAAALGVTFGAATIAGAALGPLRGAGTGHGHSDAMADAHGGGHAGMGAPAGLAASQDGYSLVPDATTLPLGRRVELSFRILGPDGQALTHFDVAHTRRMHLIVLRRDLTGYQHVHPTLDRSGWRVRLRLPEAGVYRAYADFSTDGHAMSSPPPEPETTELGYALSRAARPLDDVEPYLGADGHLVALREGDLAFLHVHPEESGTPGTIRFGAALPSAGRYRLFLQFKHEGRVRTVAHTLEVSR